MPAIIHVHLCGSFHLYIVALGQYMIKDAKAATSMAERTKSWGITRKGVTMRSQKVSPALKYCTI